MSDDVQVCVEVSDEAGAAQRVLDEAQRLDRSQARPLNDARPVLSARDAKGQLVGGLVGISFWNGLFVGPLPVAEQRRNQGIGRALKQHAEAEGESRGCQPVFPCTFAFQAPAFYEKLGYRPLGVLRDTPLGSARTWYSKWLS